MILFSRPRKLQIIFLQGEMWEKMLELEPEEANAIVHSIRVFGRCTPIHKVSVVATFVNQGYITMMCGDGGNDCGALKTAHVGIALSDAEASIVSPFTSLDKSIESVVEILREGRCALASALASYKYVVMYGQIEAVSNVFNAYYRTSQLVARALLFAHSVLSHDWTLLLLLDRNQFLRILLALS